MSFQGCISKSTIHGIGNIGNTRNVVGKLTWILLTMIMMSCFIFHTMLLYNQLSEEHVLVSTRPNALPFIQPDVVFCLERIFATDFLINPPDYEYEYMLNVSKNIEKFDLSFRNVKPKFNSYIWDSLNINKLYRAFFHRKHQLFLTIMCNIYIMDLDEITVEINYFYLACYRISSSLCRLTSPMDALMVKFYIHNFKINKNYSRLNVTINNKTIDSYIFNQRNFDNEIEEGVQVFLVQPNEGINEGTAKITASVNSHTRVKIKSIKYVRLSTKKSTCQENIQYKLMYNPLEENMELNPLNVTSDSFCIESYFQNFTYHRLRCVSKSLPIPIFIPSNFSFCGNIYRKSYDYTHLFSWNLSPTKENAIVICKANSSCTTIEHNTIVNYNNWPSSSNLNTLFEKIIPEQLKALKSQNKSTPGLSEALKDFQQNPSNKNAWKKNFIKITISPGEYMSTVIEEIAAYSFKNFFSDTGGIMGFYLGASLLTLCEVFRLMNCAIKYLRHSRHNPRKKEEDDLQENIDI